MEQKHKKLLADIKHAKETMRFVALPRQIRRKLESVFARIEEGVINLERE